MALVPLKNYQINVDVHAGLFPRDVVFLHGNLASNTWWQPALEVWRTSAEASPDRSALTGRAICVEWRGCGKSTGPASAPHSAADLAPAQLAQDLIELAHVMDLQNFDLIGHSLGGLICLMAAVRAPEMLSKLILLDSVGALGVQFPKEGRDAFLQMKDDRTFCAAVMSSTIHNCDVHTALFEQIVNDTMGIDPLIWTAIPEVLAHIDIRESLMSLRVPTLVIHGDQDPILPKADAIALAQLIPQARYLELSHHGHSPNVESPALFTSIVDDFLLAKI